MVTTKSFSLRRGASLLALGFLGAALAGSAAEAKPRAVIGHSDRKIRLLIKDRNAKIWNDGVEHPGVVDWVNHKLIPRVRKEAEALAKQDAKLVCDSLKGTLQHKFIRYFMARNDSTCKLEKDAPTATTGYLECKAEYETTCNIAESVSDELLKGEDYVGAKAEGEDANGFTVEEKFLTE